MFGVSCEIPIPEVDKTNKYTQMETNSCEVWEEIAEERLQVTLAVFIMLEIPKWVSF